MNSVPVQPVSPASPAATNAAVQRAQVERLAHEFEAMLIQQMLQGMRQSMLSDDEENQGLGAETMTETFDQEIAQAFSRAGGIGLAKTMTQALEQQLIGSSGAAGSTNGATALALPTPALPPALSVPVSSAPAPMPAIDRRPAAAVAPRPAASATAPEPPAAEPPEPMARTVSLPGTVTSPFGWRHDPFTGQVRFHAGTDLRAAYGQPVQAIGGGTVVFAGQEHGYGLMVAVDDGAGTQTRYAHLSEADVRVGDRIQPGQMLARAGSSGRSTGPHLHLEVRRDGKAVDPSIVLKESGPSADSLGGLAQE